MKEDILLKTLILSGFKRITVAGNTGGSVICVFVWAGFAICGLVVAVFHD